jgi:two-component system sensor histidine kinase KdpD
MLNSHQSGAFTSYFEDCTCRYLSVFSGDSQNGVIGIDMEDRPFTEFENTILLSIVHEGTMALENKRIIQEQKKAEINAENERLRTVLLRSISHDLLTPLTSIYGNAANLRSHEADLPREERDKLYGDIMEDAGWLNAQFENILAMTRLESGPGVRMTIENMEDVIEESLRHLPAHPLHEIVFLQDAPDISPDAGICLPLVQMDSRLIMQVLINLLGNALKYTPDGTRIEIRLACTPDTVTVDVADEGPGIPDDDKPHVFELFYTGHHTLSDSSRSMGLGLNLCAQILHAHGGSIEVLDNIPAGAVFRFRLPAARIPTGAVRR